MTINNHKLETSIVDIENGSTESQDTNFSHIQLWEKTKTTNDDREENNEDKKLKKDKKFKKRQQLKSVLCRVAFISVVIFLSISAVLVWCYMGWFYGIQAGAIAVIVLLITSGKWRWFWIAAITSPRDFRALLKYIRILYHTRKLDRQNASVGEVFQEHVLNHPDKPCIVSDDKTWTFSQINNFANQIANYLRSNNFKKSDNVALFMENRPEFVASWLGLSKLGVVVALVNTNQRQKSLIHSITIVNCVAIIFSESLKEAIDEIDSELPKSLKRFQYNDEKNIGCPAPYIDFHTVISTASTENPIITNIAEKPGHHDKVVYIYTSGTTGMPKAAVLNHARFVFMVMGIHYMGSFTGEDIFYTPLPLYHTAGGIMSIGQAILFGATVVIRKKFSASKFFPDCEKYNCTVAQYIGEMCRYILATPPSSADKNHKLKLIFGNGLRPQIWQPFVERFGIKRVMEFYGATEGNANIINTTNTMGAIGFVSRIIPSLYPISIIAADPFSGEPIRDKHGLCRVCEPNEPGVFIGKIVPGDASRQFLGYADKQATEKKIIRNIFKKGDMAFISGDILVADELGYLFFKDRTGDTFRWKGENVSTSEVEALVSNEAGYRDTVVFGVEMSNTEGRAGMAAILDPEHKIDFEKFSIGIKKQLPSYARPLFIRLLTKVDVTGTFKLKKLDLQKEGFNPNLIEDRMYYLAPSGRYEHLTKEAYEKICNNEVRF